MLRAKTPDPSASGTVTPRPVATGPPQRVFTARLNGAVVLKQSEFILSFRLSVTVTDRCVIRRDTPHVDCGKRGFRSPYVQRRANASRLLMTIT